MGDHDHTAEANCVVLQRPSTRGERLFSKCLIAVSSHIFRFCNPVTSADATTAVIRSQYEDGYRG